MTHIKLGAMVFAFLALTAFVWASESDELREKARAMQREAAELALHGHQDEARKLERKAIGMLEKAEHLDRGGVDERRPELMELRRHLEKLRQEEKELQKAEETDGREERLNIIRRETEKVEDKLQQMLNQTPDQHAGPHADIARRLEHMRIAVEHLNHAGLQDIAAHVAERAEATERELHERELHEHRQAPGDDVMDKISQQLNELRREVERLHDEVSELREKR